MDTKTDEILQYVKGIPGMQGSHGLDHVMRVVRLCEVIGREEHADMLVLLPAALFHDSARQIEEDTGLPHEEEGARMAGAYLRSIRFDEERTERILHAVRTHRFRSRHKPQTLEAQILSDADKLDAMGAVGIARTFIRAGEHGGEIRDGMAHMREKLLNLNSLMYTGTARKMAEDRHRFLSMFLETLEQEMSGTDTG